MGAEMMVALLPSRNRRSNGRRSFHGVTQRQTDRQTDVRVPMTKIGKKKKTQPVPVFTINVERVERAAYRYRWYREPATAGAAAATAPTTTLPW